MISFICIILSTIVVVILTAIFIGLLIAYEYTDRKLRIVIGGFLLVAIFNLVNFIYVSEQQHLLQIEENVIITTEYKMDNGDILTFPVPTEINVIQYGYDKLWSFKSWYKVIEIDHDCEEN